MPPTNNLPQWKKDLLGTSFKTNQLISLNTIETFMKFFTEDGRYFTDLISSEVLTCSNGEVQYNLARGEKLFKAVADGPIIEVFKIGPDIPAGWVGPSQVTREFAREISEWFWA